MHLVTPLLQDLYDAQRNAQEVIQAHYFPRYTTDHVQSRRGLYGITLRCYTCAYKAACEVDKALKRAMAALTPIYSVIVRCGGNYSLQSLFARVVNTAQPYVHAAFPINLVNGQRHFALPSRWFEKRVGDRILYPLSTLGMHVTNEVVPGYESLRVDERQTIAGVASELLNELDRANRDELKPGGAADPFQYEVEIIDSTRCHAFAAPGGKIAMHSKLFKVIKRALDQSLYQDVVVGFADGSTATVSLKDVGLDDVIAALIGREMALIASRYSIARMCAHAVYSFVVNSACYLPLACLKKVDRAYQTILNRDAPLQGRERFYARAENFFERIAQNIERFSGVFSVHTYQHQADVTGAYFVSRAGRNPLGALYLQEVLKNNRAHFTWPLLREMEEFVSVHPSESNRKRALFAGIMGFAPQSLFRRITWDMAYSNGYHIPESSVAVRYPWGLYTDERFHRAAER